MALPDVKARGCVASVGCGRYGNILENRNKSIGKDNVIGSSGFRVA